jgi:hypothetical protein
MKSALASQKFTRSVDILDGVPAFLDEIQRDELENVF